MKVDQNHDTGKQPHADACERDTRRQHTERLRHMMTILGGRKQVLRQPR